MDTSIEYINCTEEDCLNLMEKIKPVFDEIHNIENSNELTIDEKISKIMEYKDNPILKECIDNEQLEYYLVVYTLSFLELKYKKSS